MLHFLMHQFSFGKKQQTENSSGEGSPCSASCLQGETIWNFMVLGDTVWLLHTSLVPPIRLG